MPDTDTIDRTPRRHLHAVTPLPTQQVLVVANHSATSPALITQLRKRASLGAVSFHLVVPALNSRLRHWLSDSDEAVSAARRRGQDAAALLESHGLPVTVEIGDSVPLLAIEDALSQFNADEIVIATREPNRSHWLEHDLVELARRRFRVPVVHVVGLDEVVPAA
jgi:nucleotide-binding universal stress UspA family protein